MFVLAALILFASVLRAADKEVVVHFDVPAESLDRALRDFATQAQLNISYDPSLVSGRKAAALKGDFTPSVALALLLAGTPFKVLTIDDHTLQVTEDRKTSAAEELEEIIVTGTHIRGAASASPVMEVGREEIERSGYTSVADLLLSLPQNFGGGINPGSSVGNNQVNNRYADNPTGASVPNLRGLGPGSTLSLIDGHRMASGLGGGGADITSIPLDAIERVEIVTDSASAIYGSDAVAGVVNIILRRDFEGAKTDLSYSYAPQGGGAEKGASQLLGAGWDGGHVMLGYEHRQQDAVDAKDRDFTAGSDEPFSLLPSTKSNSLTLSGRQSLGGRGSVFLQGLYVARDANKDSKIPLASASGIEYPSSLRKFAVSAGVDINLPRDWQATLSLSDAQDRTAEDVFFLTSPRTPGGAERLFGALRGIEASANGSLIALPAGPLRLAVGLGYRHESFSDADGLSAASLSSRSTGNRNIRYAFGELSVPLIDRVNLTLSTRTEHYSDAGGNNSPKVGLVYTPVAGLKLRASWGEAFKAPNLDDKHVVQQLVLLSLSDPAASSGASPALLRIGGNPGLQPETAHAWSLGADYTADDNHVRASGTVFEIRYRNRLAQIANAFAALSDPNERFFVTPSPSAAFAQAVVDSYPPTEVFNFTGTPLDPATVKAIVDDRLLNLARQTARGVDLNANYRIDVGPGNVLLFLNVAYLDLVQQNSPDAASERLSGLAYYPPKFRGQAGLTWGIKAWSFTSTVNYLARETNTQVTPTAAVGSWTTLDASIRYAPPFKGIWGGINCSLSALNVFNKDPPFVASALPGLSYDSSNVSPLGRLITLQVAKKW